MQTYDLDKLMKLVDNKFHLIIGIVERVQLLKRGVGAKVPRRNRNLITVAMEEMENDLLSFKLEDSLTEEVIKTHQSDREALVTSELAREEALAAQNSTLGFGTNIDRRPLSVSTPQAQAQSQAQGAAESAESVESSEDSKSDVKSSESDGGQEQSDSPKSE